MKLNLGSRNDIRSGYLNIDNLPLQVLPPKMYRQGDIQSLDWIAEDSTVEEIVALNCLQYISLANLRDTIQNWVQKLQPGGVLKIQAFDIYVIASAFIKNQLNLSEFTNIIFGSQKPDDDRKSIMDMMTLCQLLCELGLIIETKRYDGISLYVEAKK